MNETSVRCTLMLAAMLPLCASTAAETGTWLGSGWVGEVPHAVRLELRADGGELRLGAPSACRVPLSRDGTRYVAGPSTSGGAACERLLGETLTVAGDGHVLHLDGASAAPLILHALGDAATTADGLALAFTGYGTGTVQVRLETAALGQRAGEWRQGAPASCRIPLELAAVDGERRWYAFSADSSGGACDGLVDGVLALPDPSGHGASVLDGHGRRAALAPR